LKDINYEDEIEFKNQIEALLYNYMFNIDFKESMTE